MRTARSLAVSASLSVALIGVLEAQGRGGATPAIYPIYIYSSDESAEQLFTNFISPKLSPLKPDTFFGFVRNLNRYINKFPSRIGDPIPRDQIVMLPDPALMLQLFGWISCDQIENLLKQRRPMDLGLARDLIDALDHTVDSDPENGRHAFFTYPGAPAVFYARNTSTRGVVRPAYPYDPSRRSTQSLSVYRAMFATGRSTQPDSPSP